MYIWYTLWITVILCHQFLLILKKPYRFLKITEVYSTSDILPTDLQREKQREINLREKYKVSFLSETDKLEYFKYNNIF